MATEKADVVIASVGAAGVNLAAERGKGWSALYHRTIGFGQVKND